MTKLGVSIAIICIVNLDVRAARKPFERVEQFPAGEQGASMRSLVSVNDLHTETFTLEAPYAAAWTAVKTVAQKLDKFGGRPIAAISEQSGRIQNGRIQMESMGLSGKMMDFRDEFVTEITATDAKTTTISVTRKLVKKTVGSSRWQVHVSNGKIERWMITQVIDEVSQNSASPSPSNISQAAIPVSNTSFVSKDNANDVLELNQDKTFRLTEKGRQMSGTYEWSGDTLSLIVGRSRSVGRLSGDTLTDTEGKVWMRKGASPSAPTTDGAEVIGNAEIVKLVQAKLQDGIIISKIKGASCRFDLSTDALIKLKEANVSDAVIQAMTDAPRK